MRSFQHYWKAEFLKVIRSPQLAFHSDAYTLPIAHDYRFFSNGTYIGSIYLLRTVEHGPFSLSLRSLVTHLQTQFASFLLTRILWKQSLGQGRVLQRFGEVLRRLPGESRLSAAESRIAALFLAGEGEQEIAETLSLSIHTIQNHKKAIYRKTGVSSLSELFSRVLSDSFFDR